MVPLRPKPFDVTASDSTARLCPLARVPYAVVFSPVAARGRAGDPDDETLALRAWSARLPGRSECLCTETPIAGTRAREDAESPAPRRPSRDRGPRSVKIAAHFSPAVHSQLRMLGATQRRTVQSLLGEALNELFRKHGRRPIAGE